MDVLFIHQAFPAQFGRLALELSRRYGWRCRFLVERYSSCPSPTPEMLGALTIDRVPSNPRPEGGTPWPRVFEGWLEQCVAYRRAFEGLGDWRPDLIVAHGGQGAPSAFLREVTDAPIINYCEYYFPNRFADLTYRVDLGPAEPAPFYPRCINATTLMALQSSDLGYAPTRFQRDSFPDRYRGRIAVHHDGIDTGLYHPGTRRDLALPDGRRIGDDAKVVTFVSRGLESIRGYDLFLDVATRIARERSDVLFVVAGAGQTYYGWDNHYTGSNDFKGWAAERHGIDASRFAWLGHVEPEVLAGVLRRSDLHLYPSVPFVPSWSLFNALASGCVVIGSETAPVLEIIEPGRSGLVAPLFDAERWADLALEVLGNPSSFAPIGRSATSLIEERYGLDVCVPSLHDFFDGVASRGGIVEHHAFGETQPRIHFGTIVEPESEAMEDIRFYRVKEPFGEFSNFAPFPIVIDAEQWPTSEHYFQSQKFEDRAYRKRIRETVSPSQAARLGRDRSRRLRDDWEVVKDGIMLTAVRAKFSQHDGLRALLMSTGDATIVEHTKNDAYWGDGGNGGGRNMLGQILMKVREELRERDVKDVEVE